LRPHKSDSNGDITSLKKQDGEVDAESLRSSYSNKSVHSLKDEQVIQIRVQICCLQTLEIGLLQSKVVWINLY